ncbi:MAG: orotidine 5'-phosphate decarboxylase [Bathelium mastoideum]|nr:MAG: orotidine 5'-phosphate decarboxylase [Bathelium mastoideum]KAI9690352.1 MAG: orotidine 5'-phosphate decarboxylase [Bathelium mastoideum]
MASSGKHPTWNQTYENRSNVATTHPLTAYLLRLMVIKQSNLCVSADVTTTNQLLELAEEVGDSIVLLKTHGDIISDFTERTIRRLREIATRKHFIVFEDRKFGDIGSTVQKQYVGGPLSIVRWAPIVNAHVFPGPAIITALKEAAEHALSGYNSIVSTEISADDLAAHPHYDPSSYAQSSSSSSPHHPTPLNGLSFTRSLSTGSGGDVLESDDSDGNTLAEQHRKPSIISVSSSITMRYENLVPPPSPGPKIPLRHRGESVSAAVDRLGPPPLGRGLLLLAQMSSEDNLLTPEYTRRCAQMAREHRDFVMGFIAQESLNREPSDNFVTMTPGVSLAGKGDGLGQQYNGPQKVVKDSGSDIIIVGRGILSVDDRAAQAEKYRAEGWKAYEERVGLRKLGK